MYINVILQDHLIYTSYLILYCYIHCNRDFMNSTESQIRSWLLLMLAHLPIKLIFKDSFFFQNVCSTLQKAMFKTIQQYSYRVAHSWCTIVFNQPIRLWHEGNTIAHASHPLHSSLCTVLSHDLLAESSTLSNQ